jgi:hypothetical protein
VNAAKWLILSLIVAISSSSGQMQSQTASPPYDLKGDRLGMSLGDFRDKHHRNVGDVDVKGKYHEDAHQAPFCEDKGNGLTECQIYFPFEKAEGKAAETIANAPADLMFEFVDGKLWGISAVFKQADFETVKKGFTEKFGDPKSSESKMYQNAFGATFSGQILGWNNGTSTILLIERNRNLNTSSVQMEHTALAAIAKARTSKSKPDM